MLSNRIQFGFVGRVGDDLSDLVGIFDENWFVIFERLDVQQSRQNFGENAKMKTFLEHKKYKNINLW